MTRARLLAVAALVLLAGCGGAADPTDTATPAPVPDAEAAALPPGVAADGVNATALAAAHRRALANRSYTLVVVDRRRVGGQELGARFAGTRRVVRVARPGHYLGERAALSSRAAFSAAVVERAAYADGTTRYVREETENGTRYGVEPIAGDRHAAIGGSFVARFLAVDNVSVVPTGDGGARIRGTQPTVVDGRYYTVEATVGPDGVVRRVHAEFLDAEGTPRFVTVTYRQVGNTSVERPSWVDDARANATATATPAGESFRPPADRP